MAIQELVDPNNLKEYNQRLTIKKIFDVMGDKVMIEYHWCLQWVKRVKLKQRQIMLKHLVIY